MPAYRFFTGRRQLALLWTIERGSEMWMESKKPFGQVVSLAGSSTTASAMGGE